MSQIISKNTWVYAIIQNPGGSEQLVGFMDNNNVKYLPVIKAKEDAEYFLSYMTREPGMRYEVQAIIYEDVLTYAKENCFQLYIIDKEGNITHKIDPEKN